MRGGGIAGWCIHHPVSTLMLTLTAIVLGLFALTRLPVDLLPQLIYPEIGVRIIDPAVPANIMEDRVTRQIEEQLAITEDAVGIESTTSEGTSEIELYFDYGKDIDVALRDASTRLDRAKRILPTTIDPPIIFKRDPSQIPVMEFVVSSALRDMTELRGWTDNVFAKYFLNLPGVAAVEVGGGVVREVQVLPDPRRLAALGLSLDDITSAIERGNLDAPAGRLRMGAREYASRTTGRINSVAELGALPIRLPDGGTRPLSELAEVIDASEDERIRVRYNGTPGVRVSVQKQPNANTVDVADVVVARLVELRAQNLISEDVRVDVVSNQAVYVRQSLNNASLAALAGAVLAMLVVYVFLGSVRGTLIIGSAIPISIMITFAIMALGGLSLNLMTLGGLALGIGMLVDNTIVMLENIERHQRDGEEGLTSAEHAAAEVNSPIVAATSTNLAAVLPFLFISGLVGLLFRELIFTITAAIVASLVVALTLVPALAARGRPPTPSRVTRMARGFVAGAQRVYLPTLTATLKKPWLAVAVATLLLAGFGWLFMQGAGKQEFLPTMDDGRVQVQILTDPGGSLEEMDRTVRRLERIALDQGDVAGLSVVAGGSIFGRSQRERPNRATLSIELLPLAQRARGIEAWVTAFSKAVADEELAGVKVRARAAGLRGVRVSRADEDVSIRVRGPDLEILGSIGDRLVERLRGRPGLRNANHSAEERRLEFSVRPDRARAAELGVDVEQVGRALRIALDGIIVGDYIEGDRAYDVRVRLPQSGIDSPAALAALPLFGAGTQRPAVHLGDVAAIELVVAPTEIRRENQSRIVEISAALTGDQPLGEVLGALRDDLDGFALPTGYSLYYGGAFDSLQRGNALVATLAGLALFLVFVVMAVQYESLRNPMVIMLGVPFALIGVVVGLLITELPISMPVWLGIIMLIGVVVNNAIVLVEYIELTRRRGTVVHDAVMEAARLRLRPIMMTTLTTVAGMSPLALGLGEGSEMLRPLAVCMVFGLLVSMFVTLLLIPSIYVLAQPRQDGTDGAATP
ncbi:MAG: AcrB/AcrD/AcrF family protein [Betaproteobacteria bacterium HGW-Betaproteobacteria-7]|jgi:CzcA family heavy metal efflux pump|nr:MAG: AcrB/AcrD/AcrF family protein [Betaproteobacteria bacterium HGW-Betaproteobacteria-7]